jgi:hypothetical protein
LSALSVRRGVRGASDVHSISERLSVTDSERAGPLGYLGADFDYAETSPGPEPVGVGDFFGAMTQRSFALSGHDNRD